MVSGRLPSQKHKLKQCLEGCRLSPLSTPPVPKMLAFFCISAVAAPLNAPRELNKNQHFAGEHSDQATTDSGSGGMR